MTSMAFSARLGTVPAHILSEDVLSISEIYVVAITISKFQCRIKCFILKVCSYRSFRFELHMWD